MTVWSPKTTRSCFYKVADILLVVLLVVVVVVVVVVAESSSFHPFGRRFHVGRPQKVCSDAKGTCRGLKNIRAAKRMGWRAILVGFWSRPLDGLDNSIQHFSDRG